MHFKKIGVTGLLLALAYSVSFAADNNSATNSKSAEAATSQMSAKDQLAKQNQIRQMRDDTLKRLFKTKPEVKNEIAKAEGYAVFDASQTNVLLLVTSKGGGVVVDQAKKKETFMKMAKVGMGPGVGHKKFKQILVFRSRKLLDLFVTTGADVAASADATFKRENDADGIVLDGSVSFNPELSVYQITDQGMMLQANWGGVGYLPDSDLNAIAK
jgi:lipid-binding SYLF domain-containing protein